MSDVPKFTRRAVLGGAAAAGAGAVIGPAGAGAVIGPARAGAVIGPAAARALDAPRGRVFSRWLGALPGRSPVITPGRRFALSGVEWSQPAMPRIELRTRTSGGQWGPWGLASAQGHDFDRGSAPASRFGEPLWCGSADQLQLRSSQPVTGVRLHFVAASAAAATVAGAGSGGGASAGAASAGVASLRLAAPVLSAGPGQPPIIARSAWAGRRAGPSAGPYYGTVALAFVHHTENPNGYAPGDVPAMLLAIYDYHRYVRGFFDIAYNFIIDAFGRIWEARAGGIDTPVIGAHAGGFNAVSTGVAVLGTFISSAPPQAALKSLERLLAWKLSLHGVPILGKVRVEVNPSGAFYTPFAPGQHVALPRVSGHRDGDQTDCPGDAFYARLPSIRPRVAKLAGVPAQLSLTAAGSTVAGVKTVVLTGRLALAHGAPIAGVPVEVQTIGQAGVEKTVLTVTTDVAGRWSASLKLNRTTIVRALHRLAPAAVSEVVAIKVPRRRKRPPPRHG